MQLAERIALLRDREEPGSQAYLTLSSAMAVVVAAEQMGTSVAVATMEADKDWHEQVRYAPSKGTEHDWEPMPFEEDSRL